MSNQVSHIHFLLDRSGSMWDCLDDTIGGFNSFVKSQQEDTSGHCFMSFYQFDHEYQIVYLNKPIREVEYLTSQTFEPRGQTALIDAIGQTISSVNARSVDNDNSTTIIVILTDGQENASKEFQHSKIKDMITEKEQHGWKFVFLGANQDAISTACNLGIRREGALTYAQTPNGVRGTFQSLSSAVTRARHGHQQVSFTDQERIDSQMS